MAPQMADGIKTPTFSLSIANGPGKWIVDLMKAAGLDDYTLQNLRQTTNTLIQEEGHSQAAVLGHIKQRVNQNHYAGALKRQRTVIDSLPSLG